MTVILNDVKEDRKDQHVAVQKAISINIIEYVEHSSLLVT